MVDGISAHQLAHLMYVGQFLDCRNSKFHFQLRKNWRGKPLFEICICIFILKYYFNKVFLNINNIILLFYHLFNYIYLLYFTFIIIITFIYFILRQLFKIWFLCVFFFSCYLKFRLLSKIFVAFLNKTNFLLCALCSRLGFN